MFSIIIWFVRTNLESSVVKDRTLSSKRMMIGPQNKLVYYYSNFLSCAFLAVLDVVRNINVGDLLQRFYIISSYSLVSAIMMSGNLGSDGLSKCGTYICCNSTRDKCIIPYMVPGTLLLLSLIYTFSVLSLQLKLLRLQSKRL